MKRSLGALVLSLLYGLSLTNLAEAQPLPHGANTWIKAPDLREARAGACAVALPDGRVLTIGGHGRRGALATAEYVGGETLFPVAPMNTPRTDHFCVVLDDGRVLVAGGHTVGGAATNAAELYNPAADTWTNVGPMLQARSSATATLLMDGRVLIAGGETSDAVLNTLETFDTKAGSFGLVSGLMTAARSQHAVARLRDGRVLIAGGWNGQAALDTVDVFDPATTSVSSLARMSSPRMGLSATLLLSGRVAFIGGSNGTTELATSEIFDPKTGAITAGPRANVARSGHMAILVPNNNSVMIAGGTSAGQPVSSVEQFRSWSGKFVSGSNFSVPRKLIAGAAPRKGLVALAGGSLSDGVVSAMAETLSAPWVATDKPDYQPGDTVTITGGNWTPGQTVSMAISETPDDGDGLITLTSLVDANGNFTNTGLTIDNLDLGVTFYLTASDPGGEQAQITFTDSTNVKTATVILENSACTTATTTFTQGQTVCAKVVVTALNGSGGQGSFSIAWFNPSGTSVQKTPNTVPSTVPTTFTDTLVTTTSTSTGTWNVGVCNGTTCALNQAVVSASFTLNAPTSIATTAAVSSSPNPSTYGQTVTLTADIAPASGTTVPVGTVQFVIDGSPSGGPVTVSSCSPSPDACATLTTSPLTTATHTVVANFTGTAPFTNSSGSRSGQVVNPQSVTASLTANNKTYDGTTISTIVTCTLTGVLAGDTGNVSCTAGSATFADKNVGSGKTVTATGISLSGSAAGNYTLSSTTATTTASITVRPITVTAAVSSKTYDGLTSSTATPTITSGSLASGDSATWTETYDTKNVGTGKALTPAGTVSDSNSGNNYAVTFVTNTTGIITAKPVTVSGITANDKPYDGTPTAMLNVGSGVLSGVVPSDASSVVLGATYTANFASSNVGTGIAVTVTGLGLTGAASGNYTLAQPTGLAANITPATPVITPGTPGSSTYGDATVVSVTVTSSIGTPTGNVTLSFTLNSTAYYLCSDGTVQTTSCTVPLVSGTASVTTTNLPSGSYTISGAYSGDSDFTIGAAVTVSVTMSMASTGTTLTVTPNPAGYGQLAALAVQVADTTSGSSKIPTGTVALSFVQNMTTYNVCADGTVTTSACSGAQILQLDNNGKASVNTSNLPVGTYTITAAYAGSANFSSSSVGQSMEVDKADTTTAVSSSAGSVTYGQAVTLTAMVSGKSPSALNPPNGSTSDTVQFAYSKDGGATWTSIASPVQLTSGSAQLVTTALPAGTNKVQAAFSGDSNFTGSSATAGQMVSQLTVTASVTATNKTYDGNNSATITNCTVSPIAGTDDVSCTAGSATFADRNVGTGKTVTATGISLTGATAGNYTLSSTTAMTTASISAASLTITAVTNTKTFDGTISAMGVPTTSGLQGADAVTGLSETYDTKNAGTGKTLTVAAGYTVNDGNNGGNYTVALVANTTGVINKASLTITAATNTKTYDGTTSAGAVPTTSGLVGTDTVTGLSETYDTKNAGTGKTLTVAAGYTVNDGNGGNNYTVTPVTNITGVIDKAMLTITAATNTKTYDGNTSAAGVPTTSGLVGGDTVTGLTETYDTKNAGTGKTLTVAAGYTVNDGNGGNNYTVTPVTNTTGVINKAPLTITAATNTKTYDGNTSAAAVPTISGLVGGDTVTGLTETYDTKNAGNGKTLTVAAGYMVNDGNNGGNYTVTPVTNTTGLINKAMLTITAATNTKTYDGNTSAAAIPMTSGLVGGDTVTGLTETYDTKNAGNGKILTVSAGYTVNDGNNGGNYTVTLATNTTGVINQAPITVAADAKSKTYGTADPPLTYQVTSGALLTGDSFSGALTRVVGENVGTYAIQQGSLTTGANYALSYVSALLTINPARITVAADAKAKTYGQADPALTYQVTSGALVSGDSFSGLLTRVTGQNMGTYPIQQGTLTAGANYALTYVGALLTINPAPITVTADAKAKIYGQADPALTYQVTSGALVSGDSFSGSLTRVTGQNVGTYAIQQGLLTAGSNYALSYIGANLTINKASLTITAVSNTKTYDGGISAAATPTATGLQFSDTLTGLTETYDTKNVGMSKMLSVATYTVNDGNGGNNYTVSPVANTTGVINKASLTITAVINTKTYDGGISAAARPTVLGLQGTDTVTGLSETYDTKNVGTGKVLSVATYTVNDGNNSGNYTVTFATINTGVITPAPITATADAQSKLYGQMDPPLTFHVTSGALASGDSFTGSLTRVAGENVGPYAIQQGTLTAGANYALTYLGANLTILPAPTTTALASGLSTSVDPVVITLKATVTSSTLTPAGAVTFTDGSTPLGTVALSSGGQATLTLSLPVGTHLISAAYNPTPNFLMSASGANTAPVVTITGPASGFVQAVNTAIPFSATFTDPDTSSPSAQWSFDTTAAINGTVGAGSVTGSYSFAAAGVYGIALTFNDGLGGITIVNTAPLGLPASVVIYDPSAGFVTGGGWINSPAGAYTVNPSLTGKASFGFVSKYEKGATVPTGETEFNFQVASFDFHSSVYQWLVVSGGLAQYKGTGTINGAGSYNFLLTARDGALVGGNSPDGFRIKITDPATGRTIYDNLMSTDDTVSSGNTEALGGGSIIIHSK
ncbi:MAG TPA: YDG domain-containing protein [Bryobacteraceae bacterium]|nr:YDG domain-containing protein [Bryobacteraceae bacterium]